MGKIVKQLAVISRDKEIIELALELGWRVVGFFDSDPGAWMNGIAHLGPDSNWGSVKKKLRGIKLALALDPPKTKEAVAEHYGLGYLAELRSKDAYVSPSAKIGTGCLIQRGAKIFSNTFVGHCCKINVGATIHHDSLVGNCCTLTPGATLLGGVTVGDRVYIGAGAIILPGITIKNDAIIGAGAVVTKDVAAETTMIGVPARAL